MRSRGAALLAPLAAISVLSACDAGSAEPDPDVTIGLVTNNPNGLRNVAGFIDGMTTLGYIEDEDVTYLNSGEPLTGAALDREIEDFAAADVDLVFTAGTPTGVAAHRILAGTGIPIVFGVIADPLAAGVMEDLTRPGGNMTGVKLGQDQLRRLELLLEIAPTVERVFIPYNPDDSAAASAVEQVAVVADQLGIELVLAEGRTDDEVTQVLASVPDAIDAVFFVPDSTVNARLQDFLAVAEARGLPTSGPSNAQVEEGALMAYGFVHERAGAQAARIADQVLGGADPGDLPVEDTESFLGINLVTAEDIGLEVTDAVLQQAEVIFRHDSTEGAGG